MAVGELPIQPLHSAPVVAPSASHAVRRVQRLSIVMPARNEAQNLGGLLAEVQCVLAQTALPFHEVIAPAIDLADGFSLDDMRANAIAYSQPFFNVWPTSKAHFLPNGRALRSGEIFRQPDLA